MKKFQAMDEFLSKLVTYGPTGCGCAVAQDGKILYENYFGYSNLEKQEPITADSIYRQFSSTKVIIVTAAMILFERGKFLLTDPISEYFPEWKDTMVADTQEDGSIIIRPAKRPIQVQDCFNMAMGIGYGGEDYTHQMAAKARAELQAIKGKYTLRDDIRAMSKVPIRFDPGTRWLYGFGHELVAGLIEVTSGMTVGKFLKEEIFDPLQMNSTGYRYFGDMREKMVTIYHRDEAEQRVPMKGPMDDLHEPDAIYEGGGFGLFSSVGDYLKFSQALACGGEYGGERIIGRKTINLMRQNRLDEMQLREFRSGPYLDGYGYGLGVRTLMDPARGNNASVGEFGWTGMAGTYVSIDPAEKASIVYMHNLIPNMEEYVHPRIRNIAYGALK